MNRRTEIVIGSIIVILLVSFFGFKLLGGIYDKDAALEKLDEAIVNKDVDYIKEHIEIRGLARDLTKEEVANIAEVLKDISVYSLKDQKDNPEANIFIMQKGREKIFFDKYIIGLKPYKLTIEANVEGTEIFINEENVGKFEKEENFIYEDLLPGIHQVKLLYEGEYSTIEAEEDLRAFNKDGSPEIYLPLQINGKYVYVESNLEEANLFIDGEDTGINIYGGYRLGPLDEKKRKISARAKIDGEEYESDIEEISESSGSNFLLYIDYEPTSPDEEDLNEMGELLEKNEEISKQVNSLIEGYERGLINAINSGSYTYLEDYIEDGSSFMKSQRKLVSDLYEKGTSEELLSYGIKNIDIVSEDEIYVTVSENHMIYYKDGKKKEVNNRWDYTVVSKGDKLLIRELKKAE